MPFATLDELLDRPRFDDYINCIPLLWREDLLAEDIFPISYNRFWSLWDRTTRVAGYQERLRPYALPVGAGSRLNGTLACSPPILPHVPPSISALDSIAHFRK